MLNRREIRQKPLTLPHVQYCKKCYTVKCLNEFERCASCNSGYRYRCKECRRGSYVKKGKPTNNPSWFKKGKDHPYFVDGKWRDRSLIGKNKRFQAIRKKVLERDKFCCFDCGSRERLHVHHVIPIRDDASLAYDIDNLVVLCPKCHVKCEGLKKRGSV